MTNVETNTANQTHKGRRPDWVVKVPRQKGKGTGLVRIGAAWDRADGGICIRLTGNQIISGDVYVYPSLEGAPS